MIFRSLCKEWSEKYARLVKYLWICLSCLFLLLNYMLVAQELTIAEKITQRFSGPLHLRFVLQPLVAILIGLKDGRSDALAKTPPYFFSLFQGKTQRKESLKEGFISISKVLTIGVVLDIIAQVILFQYVRILGAILVGITIIGLPYSLSRGISNRIKSFRQ